MVSSRAHTPSPTHSHLWLVTNTHMAACRQRRKHVSSATARLPPIVRQLSVHTMSHKCYACPRWAEPLAQGWLGIAQHEDSSCWGAGAPGM
jgi:hypothetical protein